MIPLLFFGTAHNDEHQEPSQEDPVPRDRPTTEGSHDSRDLSSLAPRVGPVSHDHPAYDRVQTRDTPPVSSSSVLRGAAVILLMVATLALTYFALRPSPQDGALPDLLTLIAAHADVTEVLLATDDLDMAQEFILAEFGWPVRVPVLPDARLEGVGVDEIADGIEVPVLKYMPQEGGPITVFMYDYAFLDAAAGRLKLTPAVYSRLADEDPVDVRRVGETTLVLWRRRAAIYTAVTTDDPAPLVDYLRRRP